MMNASFALAGSLGDRFSQAGIVTLQGMLTIFVVLAILWAAIEVMHRIIHGAPKKSESASKKPTPAAKSATDDAAIAAAIAAALAASEDDGATVAAITAAITAARAEEGNDTPFRVVSFKRASNVRSRRRF